MSHKKEDATAAGIVAAALKQNGHEFYVDIIDENIGKSGDDLGDYIRQRLSECNSLIAVVSRLTRDSQWVPWEIGVATEKGYPLSTYLSDGSSPPEFLAKWPVLRTIPHLNAFASQARRFELEMGRKELKRAIDDVKLSESALTNERKSVAAEFHRNVKALIGQ